MNREKRRKEEIIFAKAIRRAKAAGIIEPKNKKPIFQRMKEFLSLGNKDYDSLRPEKTS